MIVYKKIKVQVSIGGEPATLIYSKDREIMTQVDRSVGEEVLKGDLRGFFKCAYNRKTRQIQILNKIKEQGW